jgi:hypothetical protein
MIKLDCLCSDPVDCLAIVCYYVLKKQNQSSKQKKAYLILHVD